MLLERFAYTHWGTFGKITVGDKSWFTIERPWNNNEPNISCIPTGVYALWPARFNKGDYEVYEILNVPGRTEVKIHIATTMDDVLGCVGLGKALGFYRDKWCVIHNKAAFNEFMDECKANPDECKSIVIRDFR
jgi:hypothetical protein